MTRIAEIYEGAERLINDFLRKEIIAQGHHLIGAMEDSLSQKTSSEKNKDIAEGFALYYTKFVNEGVPASSVSFKQAPFLIEYFKKRGLSEKEATAAAFATIKVWMKQGMPTQSSKRFSETGSRTNLIENSFVGHSKDVDEYMGNGIDFVIEELFQQEKSETI
jgi:hypothetical protein